MSTDSLSYRPSKLSWPALLLVLVGALFYCYEYVLRVMPSLMIGELTHHFSLLAGGTGLLLGIYYFVYSPLQIAVGVLTDYYRPRRTLTYAILFCVIGCLLSAPMSSVWTFGAGRALIGLGSAFAYVGALTLANTWLSEKTFTYFAGGVTTMGMLAGWACDHGLVHLGQSVGWSNIFYAAALVGLALVLVFQLACRANKAAIDKRASKHTIKWKPVLTGYWRIIKTPSLWLVGVIGAILFLSLSVFAEAWGPQFIHTYLAIPISQAAHINGMLFIGWAVGAPLQGLLFAWVKRYRPLLLVQSLLATICIGLVLYGVRSTTAMSLHLFLFGFFSSVEVLCFTYAAKKVAPAFVGSAVAFVNLIIMLSGTFLQPIASFLLEKATASHHSIHHSIIPVHSIADYQHAFVIMPALGVAATLMAFFIKPIKPTHEKKPA